MNQLAEDFNRFQIQRQRPLTAHGRPIEINLMCSRCSEVCQVTYETYMNQGEFEFLCESCQDAMEGGFGDETFGNLIPELEGHPLCESPEAVEQLGLLSTVSKDSIRPLGGK